MRRFLVGAMAAVLLLSGCGGGSGSTSSTPAAATGVFSDAPVEGLRYVFGRYSGVTGSGGTFTYEPGKIGVFRIGDLVIGRSAGGPVVTVVDLVKTAHPEYTDQQAQASAVTLVRFLTSVGGGAGQTTLTIPSSLLSNALGSAFRNTDLLGTDLQLLLASLGSFTLTSAQAASDHMAAALANLPLARQAGEYVSTDTNDTPIYLKIDSAGNVTGAGAAATGESFYIGGTVDATGAVSLGDAAADNARSRGYSATATSNGDGAITGTLTFTDDTTRYPVSLRRVTAATYRYSGIFAGTYTGTVNGEWDFGITAAGDLVGWEEQLVGRNNGGRPGVRLTGKVDIQTGKFELKGSGVTFSGTISGSSVSGTWTNGTESGAFSGSMIGG